MTPQLQAAIDRVIVKMDLMMTTEREKDSDRLLYDVMAEGSSFDEASTQAADYRIQAELVQQTAIANLRRVLPQLLTEL